MTQERQYTLDEARQVLASEECRSNGHDWDVITERTFADPAGTPLEVICTNCHERHAVKA